MSDTVNGEMIQLAREARALTQTELSERSGISQSSISKFERDELGVSQEQLERISAVLNYPPLFFCRRNRLFGLSISGVYHRRRKSLPMLILKRIQAEINIRTIEIQSLLGSVDLECENEFCGFDIEEFHGNAEYVAELLRAKWRLPLGPIKSVIGAIEDAGGIVVKCDFGTRKLDAQSHWIPGMPPLFFVNKDIPADRLRFTLSHEIGHIVMHRVPTPNIEAEADLFASAFLMPRDEIISELSPFSLERAMRLKRIWKVSIAALIMRAYSVGVIPEWKKRELFTRMSAAGYRTEEPVVLETEEPSIVRRLIETHEKGMGYGTRELASHLALNEDEFCDRYARSPLRIRRFRDQ